MIKIIANRHAGSRRIEQKIKKYSASPKYFFHQESHSITPSTIVFMCSGSLKT